MGWVFCNPSQWLFEPVPVSSWPSEKELGRNEKKEGKKTITKRLTKIIIITWVPDGEGFAHCMTHLEFSFLASKCKEQFMRAQKLDPWQQIPLKLRKWRINVFVQNDSVEMTCIIQREVALLRWSLDKGTLSYILSWKYIVMPQGKLRGGGLRGEVQSTVRESYGGKAVSSNFKSRVVHPRNPKLVKGSAEDDKVNAKLYIIWTWLRIGR